jgi:lysophospholipase L1-like esterase
MARPRHLAAGGILLAALISGCGDSHDRATAPTTPTTPTSAASSQGAATPELDSMVVLGHSGTTGYDSDPKQPGADVRENSWATGTNPKVDSIYLRLLADHPALEGHATSLGVDGSTVDDLAAQVDAMMELDPLPDVVVIQTMDNDMKCDGTDAANEKVFGKTLDAVLTSIDERDPDAQVFLVDQPISVRTFTEGVKDLPGSVIPASGNGPCDTYTFGGKVREAGIASLQAIVDGYFHTAQRVCASHPRCWTDRASLQRMPFRHSYLAEDGNHLTVAGLRVMARYAWAALPAAIKDRA